MARRPRLSIAAELHYVVHTGHNGQSVFADDADRTAFLAMLRDAAQTTDVALHAYALLDNAVHLLAVPAHRDSLGRLMQSLGRQYVAAFNRRHARSGSLWAGRFRCAPIDATWGYAAMLEVEASPVWAGLVAEAVDYRWSSAPHHLGRFRDPVVVDHPAYWAIGNTPFERESVHARNLAQTTVEQSARLAAAAMQGRAVGNATFLKQAALWAGEGAVQPARRGRPRKPSEKSVPL